MGSLRWTDEQLAEFEARQAQWRVQGTVRTHQTQDDKQWAVEEERKEKAKAKEEKRAEREKAKEAKKAAASLAKTLAIPVGVRDLLRQIELWALPLPILEHRFHAERKWRFDMAWESEKLAVEVDGGVWTGGRHTRGKGFENDCEKVNQAQIMGWTVLRYSTGQVRSGMAVKDLAAVIGKEAMA
jgi:hypothetical protein